jgi:hypothetical protein
VRQFGRVESLSLGVQGMAYPRTAFVEGTTVLQRMRVTVHGTEDMSVSDVPKCVVIPAPRVGFQRFVEFSGSPTAVMTDRFAEWSAHPNRLVVASTHVCADLLVTPARPPPLRARPDRAEARAAVNARDGAPSLGRGGGHPPDQRRARGDILRVRTPRSRGEAPGRATDLRV